MVLVACSSPDGQTATTSSTTSATSSSGGGGSGIDGGTTSSSGSGGTGGAGAADAGKGGGGAPAECGNGLLEAGEECDGADLAGKDCPGLGFFGGTIGCTAQCTFDASLCHNCGDGLVDPGEDCDGAALNGGSCVSLGFDLGALGCTPSCAYDASQCAFFTCGDGTVDGAEQCDGADLGGATCVDLGFYGGQLGCTSNCVLDTAPCLKCGDGTKNGPEPCDGADLGGATCATLGFDGGALACTSGCALDASACFKCGDGTKNGSEQCDDMDLGGSTCATLGFDGGALACTSGCALDTSACFKCGDGTKNGSEQCDGADLGGATCTTLGFAAGALACSPACTLDSSQCLGACAVNATPVVTLPPTLIVDADQPFAIHATIADDDPPGALTITWSASAGAPPLSGATTADPSSTAGDCGQHQYTVTVTDPCGHSDSASIQVTVPANGPHVSSATCDPLHQCGSIQRPWCTIQKGVDQTSSSPVKVAGASTPYLESVQMRDGVDVLGGYEPTFTAARNLDPATISTIIRSTTTAVGWGAAVAATLDGFRITPAMPATSSSQRAVLAISGSADAMLANITIDASTGTPRYSTEYAVRVGAGTGGSLVVQSSTLRTATAGGSTIALSIDAAADISISLSQFSLIAANPSASSGASVGIEQLGVGSILAQGGLIKAGLAASTHGLRAPSTTSTMPRRFTLVNVDVEGNTGQTAYGIRIDGADELHIQGGSVRAKGSNNTSTVAVGVHADSVGHVELDGVTVEGTDAVYGLGESVSAHGVRLSNLKNVANASAVISNSDVLGGTLGQIRKGVLSEGVPLDVLGSTIAGTRTAAVYGNSKGPYGATGVELTGTFPPGTTVHFQGNQEIIGGDSRNPCFNYQCGGAAVLINSAIDSIFEQNQTIRGAYAVTGYPMDGIRINAGGTHLITGNGTIEAGNDASGNWAFTAGVRVASLGSTIANVTVQQNTLIAGNASGTSGGHPCGFHGEGVNATIVDNTRILGGYGTNPIGVSIARSRTTPNGPYSSVVNSVDIHGNTIDGGTSGATGLWAIYTTGTITDNLIHTCGLSTTNGQPVTRCTDTSTSQGLVMETDQGTLVGNNYVFGGHTSSTTACRVGCYTNSAGCAFGIKTTFVHNLCVARSIDPSPSAFAKGLVLGNPLAGECPLLANNILDASGVAGTVRSFEHLDPMKSPPPQECYQLFTNDLVPRGLTCAAYVLFLNKVCYANADELNAKGNAVQQISGNVSLMPGYVAEDYLLAQSPAAYHLDATCALGGLGTAYPPLATDWDGSPRDPVNPEIGPDECQ